MPPFSRPNPGNRPVIGQAIPRTGPPPVPGGSNIYVVPGGYFPFGFGGFGYGYGYGYGGYGYDPYGYYGGFYDPLMDPFGFGYGGVGAGGYEGGGYYGGSGYSSSNPGRGEEASLRLKIKPSNAQVFVDGQYVGVVDEFDGLFHHLKSDAGVHHVEIRAPGYETLTFDVRLDPDHSTTYTGELKKIQ